MSSGTNNQVRVNASKGPKLGAFQIGTASKFPSHNSNNVTRATKIDKNTGPNDTNPPIASTPSTDQKTNSCNKLASMFDGNQENKRPILRVNLIKKSSRQSNVLSSANRRSQPTRVDNIKGSCPDATKDVSAEAISGATRASDPKICKSTVVSNNTVKNQSHNYDEAKKSQKLVVSLIKDISRTVSKEDLDEMLKEIHSAIGEIQQEQSSLKAVDKRLNSRGANKRRQDQQSRLNKTKASNSSDASISSETKEVNDFDDEISPDTGLDLIEPSSVGKSLDKMLHGERTSNIRRQKLHRQLMELSSDDDTSKDLNRKPNSSRLPARCLRITSSHAKYISPHRKRSLEERLNRAQEAREKFLEYRANRFREILKKVEEMRAWKEEDTMNLKASVQTKLQKAAAKRKEQLDKIIRKAHDEDSKVSEIQFINNLEAQNRRHDINSRKKEFEARLQDLQDERQRRFEEKQAKEVAAEERRKTLEAERKAKLLEIQQRRKLKNQKVEQQQRVKEKKRIEKNRNHEQKITAIKEAYNAGVQTLKKRINQKQEQSEHRHEVNLRHIRQKAFELSIKRYNSFISELNAKSNSVNQGDLVNISTNYKQRETTAGDTKRLQLRPFNTKKFCNLCKETISSESALFSHLRSEVHHSSINEHYGNTMLTTNEAVEIHNLRHIVDTDEPLDSDKGANSDDQQSSRASSLVNYYHSSYLSQANGGICMSENDRDSLLAIERKCRKLRHKLIVAGKTFNRDWFSNKIRSRLAQLLIQQRVARNQPTNTEATSLANTIDLSANNVCCQQNKPFYLKITRITRELISVTTDQRISGGGLMPAGIIHSVDRLLADLNKQLNNRKAPQLSSQLLYLARTQQGDLDADQLAMATKMIEFYAIDTLFLYDIVSCLVIILRKIVPNVSLTSKLPSTVASHYSTLIDPVSLNSYYCHRSPILPARIYIRIIGLLQSLCNNHSDLCYIIFQSNNMINLSDILSYRLGFIIGNESPASSISGSSSAATLSAQTIDRKVKQQQLQNHGSSNSPYAQSGTTTSGKFQVSGDDCYQQNGGQEQKAGKRQVGNGGKEQDQEDEFGEEDDLWERAETYKRTEDIVDDMTAGLCKLLATVTETILNRPLVLLNQLDKKAFDQRSDDFISYMVSVGIVDTESVIMSHIHQQQHHHHQQQQTLSTSGNNINMATTTFAASSDKCTDSSTAQTQTNFASGTAVATTAAAIAAVAASASSTSAVSSSSPMSTNNKIINFTTSCIQFVTSLVKLVTAKLPEEEEETEVATQQDSTQLLATLKMTQLSGVLTLVYDMLVHSFNSLTDHLSTSNSSANAPTSHQSNDLSERSSPGEVAALGRQLGLALHSLRLINYVAYIDIKLLQSTLAADEMLPLQLRHVCSYLISYLVQSQFKILEHHQASTDCSGGIQLSSSAAYNAAAPADTAAYSSTDLLKNELMQEIILLLGNFAYLNHDNQLMLKSGRRPTIIEQLIGLPFDYFSRTRLKQVLMPTLISCAYLNDQICSLVCQELSLSMLTSFIEDQLLAAQTESKQPADKRHSRYSLVAEELTNIKLTASRWRFERRFAKSKWLSAKKYFESQQAKALEQPLSSS